MRLLPPQSTQKNSLSGTDYQDIVIYHLWHLMDMGISSQSCLGKAEWYTGFKEVTSQL